MSDFVLSHGTGVILAASGFVLGLLAVIVLAAIEYGAWALVLPPRDRGDRKRAVGGPEGEATEQGEAISAQAGDGARLAGLWHPASTGGPTGKTAILLHGFAEASGDIRAERVAALNRAG